MDNLRRLRLQYEDGVGACDVCADKGVIGATLKLFDEPEDAGVDSKENPRAFYLRCADRKSCATRTATEAGGLRDRHG